MCDAPKPLTGAEQLAKECWNRSINAYGTMAIFQRRSNKLNKWLRGLSLAGIIFPLLIGGFVLAFGTKNELLERILIPVVLALGIAQLVFSGISIVYAWSDELQFCLDSAAENHDLSIKFKELGALAGNPPTDYEARVNVLKATDNARQNSDMKKNLSEKELRYGHRAGLRSIGRACSGCGIVPTSMESSDCSICGGFDERPKRPNPKGISKSSGS
jgi:mobilome CxxCx(11)CxxC protein